MTTSLEPGSRTYARALLDEHTERLARMSHASARAKPPLEGDDKLSLLAEVCSWHGVLPREVLSTARTDKLVAARDEVAYLLRTKLSLNLADIGKIMNRRHTSVLYSIRRHQARLSKTAS